MTFKRQLETLAVAVFGLVFRRLPPRWKVGAKGGIFDRYLAWREVSLETTTRFGARMGVQLPDAIQSTVFLTGVWEPCITTVFSEGLAAGDVFVDVGANVGYYALLAAARVGPAGKVYAFEASPRIFGELAANIRRNTLANVEAVNRAVSHVAGTCEIFMAGDDNLGHSSIIPGVARSDGHRLEAVVECGPLGALMPVADLLRARFVKIDIEGAERYAIEGLLDLLPKFSPRTEWLVELSAGFSPNGRVDIDWIFDAFATAGYAAFVVANDYADGFVFGDAPPPALLPIERAPDADLSDVLFSRSRGHAAVERRSDPLAA